MTDPNWTSIGPYHDDLGTRAERLSHREQRVVEPFRKLLEALGRRESFHVRSRGPNLQSWLLVETGEPLLRTTLNAWRSRGLVDYDGLDKSGTRYGITDAGLELKRPTELKRAA